MKTVKRTLLHVKQIFTPRQILTNARVEIAGEKIVSVGSGPVSEKQFDAVFRGEILIPGMIDLQVNGCGGGDAAEASREALQKISGRLAAGGVTSFLPTLISAPREVLWSRLAGLSEVLDEDFAGARPLGIHLEGPFLNPGKRGAHPLEGIQGPDFGLWEQYWRASRERIRLLTLAPEMDGAVDLIGPVREKIPILALGHTQSDFATAMAAIKAGANLATHLFNAMGSLHHREPGVIGAVLHSDAIKASLIADGVHLHPAIFKILEKCKGMENLVLVSDSISAAGGGDGWYHLGNLQVQVTGGVCRTQDGTLAGSTLVLDQALRTWIRWGQIEDPSELCGIVSMATRVPAELLGLESKGRIEAGADADLVLMDEKWRVLQTWRNGELVHDIGER